MLPFIIKEKLGDDIYNTMSDAVDNNEQVAIIMLHSSAEGLKKLNDAFKQLYLKTTDNNEHRRTRG